MCQDFDDTYWAECDSQAAFPTAFHKAMAEGVVKLLDTRPTKLEVLDRSFIDVAAKSDPELAGIGAVIFDEFHERSLNADLGLALAIEIREALRQGEGGARRYSDTLGLMTQLGAIPERG